MVNYADDTFVYHKATWEEKVPLEYPKEIEPKDMLKEYLVYLLVSSTDEAKKRGRWIQAFVKVMDLDFSDFTPAFLQEDIDLELPDEAVIQDILIELSAYSLS